jgi:uncharacterized protein (TIGR03435 family)
MALLLAMILVACAGRAQSPGTVAFEVASVKPSTPVGGGPVRVGCNGGPGTSDPGRITCTHMNLANLVMMAYEIQRYQLSGLTPDDSGMFEIAVKVPEGATRGDRGIMWQNLLAERFKLTVHREKKEMTAYALVVAKGGLKMSDAVDEPAPEASAPRPAGDGRLQVDSEGFPKLTGGASMAIINDKARWRASKETMEQVASMLGAQLGQPVTDATGLKGKYDFTLSWDTRGQRASPIASAAAEGASLPVLAAPDYGPDFFRALQDQLGLRLEQRKAPVEILVVDHIEKTPTEN